MSAVQFLVLQGNYDVCDKLWVPLWYVQIAWSTGHSTLLVVVLVNYTRLLCSSYMYNLKMYDCFLLELNLDQFSACSCGVIMQFVISFGCPYYLPLIRSLAGHSIWRALLVPGLHDTFSWQRLHDTRLLSASSHRLVTWKGMSISFPPVAFWIIKDLKIQKRRR
jgi:hypothetical protein